MHNFKSAILEKLKNCPYGTFEPVDEIWFFLAKHILLKHYENGNRKEIFITCLRGCQIQDLCTKKFKEEIL